MIVCGIKILFGKPKCYHKITIFRIVVMMPIKYVSNGRINGRIKIVEYALPFMHNHAQFSPFTQNVKIR